jgi:hypothetical protein
VAEFKYTEQLIATGRAAAARTNARRERNAELLTRAGERLLKSAALLLRSRARSQTDDATAPGETGFLGGVRALVLP